jgi:surfactin synthase thioesterase subunit
MSAPAWLWDVRGGRPGRSATTVVLLPHSGGSAQTFAGWEQWFPADVRLVGVQYPGRGSRRREPLAVTIAELVEEIVTGMAGIEDPFAVFGHSLGGFVGFEVCWRLAQSGRPPALFFPSAAVPPHEHRPYAVSPRDMSDSELMVFLTRYGGMADALVQHPELLRLALPVCRSDVALAHEYSYGPGQRRLDIPVVSLGGDRDPVVPPDLLRRWRQLTTAAARTYTFPSGHFYHVEHTAAVAAVMLEHLRAAATTGTGS